MEMEDGVCWKGSGRIQQWEGDLNLCKSGSNAAPGWAERIEPPAPEDPARGVRSRVVLILLSEGLCPWRHWGGGSKTPREGTQRPGRCESPAYKLTHRMHNFMLNPPVHIN